MDTYTSEGLQIHQKKFVLRKYSILGNLLNKQKYVDVMLHSKEYIFQDNMSYNGTNIYF